MWWPTAPGDGDDHDFARGRRGCLRQWGMAFGAGRRVSPLWPSERRQAVRVCGSIRLQASRVSSCDRPAYLLRACTLALLKSPSRNIPHTTDCIHTTHTTTVHIPYTVTPAYIHIYIHTFISTLCSSPSQPAASIHTSIHPSLGPLLPCSALLCPALPRGLRASDVLLHRSPRQRFSHYVVA